MTEDEKQKAIDFLKGKVNRCIGCGSGEHFVANMVYAPVYDSDRGATIGGSFIPMIAIVCKGCGRVSFFSAVAAGVIPAEAPPAVGRPPKVGA